jgi:hypothetical protein
MRYSRFSRSCCITALMLGACLPARAQDRPEDHQPAQRRQAVSVPESELGKLIELAKQNNMAVQFEQNVTDEGAAARGANTDAQGDATKLATDGKAPGVGLSGGARAQGGDSKTSASAEVYQAEWWRIALGVIGAVMLGGAGWMVFGRKPPEIDTAIGLGASAACLIAIAIWPWLLFLLVVAVIVAVIPHFLPDKEKNKLNALSGAAAAELKKKSEALRAVADGIAKLPEGVKRSVLNSIAGEAEAQHGDHETIERSVDPTLPAIRIPRDAPVSAS